MTVKEQLVNRLDESLSSGWHGPSLYKLVEDLSFEEASAKPLSHRHTIWEILNHIDFWMDMVSQVLKGREHPKIGELDDWPKMGSTEEEWLRVGGDFQASHENLKENILRFEKSLSDKIFPDDFTYEWMLQGLCNHNLYHTGQVILLRTTNP